MEHSRSSFGMGLSGFLWKTFCGQSCLVLLLSPIVHYIGIPADFRLLTRDSVNLTVQPQHMVVQWTEFWVPDSVLLWVEGARLASTAQSAVRGLLHL